MALPLQASYAPISDPDTTEAQGFLLAEEHALKNYLSGIQIPKYLQGVQQETATSVPVYFRWPSSERKIVYPFITLDLLSITPAYDRWQSYVNTMLTPAEYYQNGSVRHPRLSNYFPSYGKDYEPQEDPDNPLWASNYMPYEIVFQVSVRARSAQHDRYLISVMLTDIFPPRDFFISTRVDDVWHRCRLDEWIKADSLETIEATKRQFQSIYTIRMETEIPTSKILEFVKVREIDVDIYDAERDELLGGFHTVATP